MPSTTETGSKPAPKRQTTKKHAAAQKPEAAPAATKPTPTPAPTGESMFDDTPPAPIPAEQPPVESAAPGQASDTPADMQEGVQDEEAAKEPEAPKGPVSAEQPAPPPEEITPEPAAPEPQAPQQPVGADTSEGSVQAAERSSSGAPTRVRLGRVEGALHRVPLEVVQMLVAESGSRIATLQSSPSIADLQNRMRVSEGRCAPIFFTMAEGDERPYLLAGIEAVAAAINLDLATLSVVTIDAGDAGAAQQHLATKANGRPASSQEDVLELIE